MSNSETTTVTCSVEGCGVKVKNKHGLSIHMARAHKNPSVSSSTKKQKKESLYKNSNVPKNDEEWMVELKNPSNWKKKELLTSFVYFEKKIDDLSGALEKLSVKEKRYFEDGMEVIDLREEENKGAFEDEESDNEEFDEDTLGDLEFFEEVMDEIHSTEEKKNVEEYSTDEEIKTDTSKVSEKKLKKKEAVEKSGIPPGIYFYIHF
jgi:hypothetical protein